MFILSKDESVSPLESQPGVSLFGFSRSSLAATSFLTGDETRTFPVNFGSEKFSLPDLLFHFVFEPIYLPHVRADYRTSRWGRRPPEHLVGERGSAGHGKVFQMSGNSSICGRKRSTG